MPSHNERIAKQLGLTVGQVQLLKSARTLTNETLEQLPEHTLRRTLRRLDYSDMPGEREWFKHLQHRTDGPIEVHPLVGTLRDLDSMRLRQNGGDQVAGIPAGQTVRLESLQPPPVGGIAPTKWKSIGPGNIGGRTRAIAVHPKRQSTIWAGAAGGGIWRTDNAGASWAPVNDFLANLAITSIVVDPTNPDVLYAGTGEAFGNLDSVRGGGIFRTTNGTDWSQILSTNTDDFLWITRLAISKDGKVLLVGTNKGILRSVDPQRAIWTNVLNIPVADLKFHPTSSTSAVAGSLSSGQAWYSADGGATWKAATTGTWSGRVELVYALADPKNVFASVNVNGGEIWSSVDGGKKYKKRAGKGTDGKPVPYLGKQGWYDNVIWVGDPTDAQLVIVGGIDMWRSTDGGNSLIDISTWSDSRSAHADHHAIVSHPGYDGKKNRILFCGNDGGVFRAADARTVGNDPNPPRVSGWQELNNAYGVTQFYSGAGSTQTGVIIGGAQDNGTLAYDPAAGTEKWKAIFGGDGGYCAADPSDPKVFYGEYVFLQIHRNTDGATTDDTTGDRYICGLFWNQATGAWQWKPAPYKIPEAETQNALFIAPFILDPNKADRILAGGQSLWRTNDAKTANTPTSGPSWSQIKQPAGSYISTIAVAAGKPNIIWVGHDDGQIWRTANGTSATPAWQRVGNAGPSPLNAQRYCTRILISPFDPDVVYASFGGFGGAVPGNIWRTDDAGTTWRNLGTGLPAVPIHCIAMHPRNQSWIYIATEIGVFASETSGSSWSATNEGPANVSVYDLFWMDETLVCATHGRGMYTIDLSAAVA
jgi:hypothetical protein